MSYLAEIFNPGVHLPSFQIGTSWTPKTKIYYGTGPANIKVLLFLGPHVIYFGYKIFPNIG
jgi:hypothetical protein